MDFKRKLLMFFWYRKKFSCANFAFIASKDEQLYLGQNTLILNKNTVRKITV